jgi:hypothetical protein
MIAWLQAFLGFPPPLGIPSIANRLVFNAYLRRLAAAAPGENLKRIINKKRKYVNRRNENFDSYQTWSNCVSLDSLATPATLWGTPALTTWAEEAIQLVNADVPMFYSFKNFLPTSNMAFR